MAKFLGELTGSLVFRKDGVVQTRIEPGLTALNITSSLHITGSRLTFNGSDVIARIENLEGGIASVPIEPLNDHSGSINAWTASLETEFYSFTSSINISINALQGADNLLLSRINDITAATSSYLTSIPAGTVSSSQQISDLGFITSSGVNSYVELTDIPSGILSSSAQMLDLGFVTSSQLVTDYSDLANIPSGIVSGAAQIDALGFITASEPIPAGTISSSQQIEDLGYLTSASAAAAGFGDVGVTDYENLLNIPSGILSSSVQISALGYITSSTPTNTGSFFTTASATLNTITFTQGDGSTFNITIDTGSDLVGVTSYSELTDIPTGILSSSTQLTALGFLTGSQGDGTGSDSQTLSVNLNQLSISNGNTVTIHTGSLPGSLISSSTQISALGFITSSDADITFNGDRIVSNTDLGDLFNNSFNAGTTGSIQDFLDAVFFPNSAPSFTTNANQPVTEFNASGSTVVTITASDPEGQAKTFRTGSGYTADYIKVASDGTATLNIVPTETLFNTVDRGDGQLAHPVPVIVSDTFGLTATRTFYFNVVPNTAPKFRQTSVAGPIITFFTANRNENATSGLVSRIYFTDSESDTITVESGSDPNGHFTLTKYSTYVQIDQVTASLDFESITFYSMSLTASDEHYQSAQDVESITYLPIIINVTDNQPPTINNQTLDSISENSTNGAVVDTIAASDTEGDTITFFNFNLHRLELDNVQVPTGSYGGTSQLTDPHENPFQMNSSGVVSRKSGVFINSDLINEYQYTVQVRDSFNSASNQAIISIPITDDPTPSLSTNGTFYIVESATATDPIKINPNGYTGTQGTMSANQAVVWSTTSPVIAIASGDGRLSVSADISGSYSTGNTITAPITASNFFGTTTTTNITVNVVANDAPDVSIVDQGLNTNTAVSGSTIATVSITDIEGDTPYTVTLLGADASSFNLVSQNVANSSLLVQPTGSLGVGTYNITASAVDTFGKSGSAAISLNVPLAADFGKVYIYTSTYGSDQGLGSNYNTLMGAATLNSDVPPQVSSYTSNTESPYYKFKSGDIGSSTISLGTGSLATLRATGSGAGLDEVLNSLGSISANTTGQIIIVYPSGSDMTVPTSVEQSFNSTPEGAVPAINVDGNGWGIESGVIHSIVLDSAHLGFSEWFVFGRKTRNAIASNFNIRLINASGSLPS
jgi:hypothetical protein